MSFHEYSTDDVIIVIGEEPCTSGRGDDEFLTVTKPEEDVTYKASVDGDGVISRNKNTYHEVVLTLQQTGEFNRKLTAIYQLGKLRSSGVVILPVSITDKGSLGDLFVAAEAWIAKMPDQTFGKNAGTVQWKFGVHNPKRALMGH